ncbi:MAG: 2-oxoacid:acceptor oxidoreductase family protein [Bacillota bacterium]
MSKQIEIRLTGSGGQGLILGGIILAEAAILDGNNAVQSQSYGPEARGGASKAEVIISKDEIDFTKVEIPDLTLALTQVAFDKYADEIKEDGIILVDSGIVIPEHFTAGKVIQIPILETAANVLKKPMVANIIAMGAIQALIGAVTKESLEAAVLSRVPKGTEELNRKALNEGYKLIESTK